MIPSIHIILLPMQKRHKSPFRTRMTVLELAILPYLRVGSVLSAAFRPEACQRVICADEARGGDQRPLIILLSLWPPLCEQGNLQWQHRPLVKAMAANTIVVTVVSTICHTGSNLTHGISQDHHAALERDYPLWHTRHGGWVPHPR